jgi:uncharacterized Zn finger protein (UPF0148 family)
VIRFRCPVCGKTLKVPDNKAGRSILCPVCQESAMVPAESTSSSSLVEQPPAQPSEQPRGLFRGMRGWLRVAFVLVAGVGLVSLFLAVAGPLLRLSEETLESVRGDARIVVPGCLVLLMALIYAHLTTCPACGRPWARMDGETASLERHVSEMGAVRQVRATRQATYVCKYCLHRWSATFTEEYQEAARPRRRE